MNRQLLQTRLHVKFTVTQSFDELKLFERLRKFIRSGVNVAFVLSDCVKQLTVFSIVLSAMIPPLLSLAKRLKHFLTTITARNYFLDRF